MKVMVYNYRDFDEAMWFTKYSEELGIELKICREAPNMENASLAAGCDCLSIITSKIPAELVEEFHKQGIRYISTRTIGYDHINLDKACELGIKVGNAPYGPNGVADYAIMLILMCLRKMKRIMQRAEIQDFSLSGIQGRELPDYTVGVIGTGRIGRTVIKHLSGFGCKLQAYDIYENEETKQYASYVNLETLLETSDIITLHTPLTDDNYHLINQANIERMKDNVIIVNTARGGLIDSEALIAGIESGKIGAVGLDVVEKEFGMYYYDLKSEVLSNRELSILRNFPNVIVTPHMAFYTDNAIASMVENSLRSCKCFMEGSENPWEVA
ncbi:MAG TPA: D-isomer specific 2-hydroxyacid dehydrogenase family protein [Lachnospiraceae bacterium]|nr:D-isomer specific 2-hydroxyacid dehydrogenase family protein [Lachnospiraceae bacterium]